jgi:leucyl/phenylalanyl-tRNA--protein transferase
LPVYLLDEKIVFPSVEGAINGVLAVGGDLSVQRLIEAYKKGIFPWYNEGEPILWWSPAKRFILFLEELHISKSMRRVINSGIFTVSFDTNFPEIIHHCAGVSRGGETGTWITQDMIEAYTALYEAGYAHSVEVWKDNKIVGGLYGVSLGRCFFAESMFHLETNASKFALIELVEFLKQHGFKFLDAQVYTEHVETMGAKNISRKEFMRLLQEGLQYETLKGKWTLQK